MIAIKPSIDLIKIPHMQKMIASYIYDGKKRYLFLLHRPGGFGRLEYAEDTQAIFCKLNWCIGSLNSGWQGTL